MTGLTQDMSWREPLVTRLKALTGYENIYEYERYTTKSVDVFLEGEKTPTDTRVFRGGWVTLKKSIPGNVLTKHLVGLTLFCRFDDEKASQLTFDQMILDLQASFRDDNQVDVWRIITHNEVATWSVLTSSPHTVYNETCHLATLECLLLKG